jgi:uncharacterized 2Fe-2S/4Fe-4S cluster protein (DUF4445 family)
MTEVLFKPSAKRAQAVPGTNVLELARGLKLNITSACGGKGKCGKCKVLIEEGREALNAYTDAELQLLSPQERERGYRLSCAISVPDLPRFTITVPSEVEAGMLRLQVEGLEVPLALAPLVRKYVTTLSQATMEDNRSDEDRLLDTLQREHGLANLALSYEGAKQLPSAMEQGQGVITSIIWEQSRIIAIEPGDTASQCFGLAVDIGTTKIACFLVDLNSGQLTAVSSSLNPQTPYGEDVVSRIAFALESQDNLSKLQEVVLEGINQMVEESCKQVGCRPEHIYEGCFVGNTCMMHLFLGLSPKHLAFSPYCPVVRKGLTLEARRLPFSLRMHHNAMLYALPAVAGFVGADNIAVQLTMEPSRSEKPRLILDIGTNTEIVLQNGDSALACSCASGPAFEGMQVKHGMKAEAGAIEKVEIDPTSLEVDFQTIGGRKPIGICGSGVVDALAQFLSTGIMGRNGRMNGELAQRTPRMRKGTQGWEFVIAWDEETAIDSDIVITQEDISELQKAKAAIHSGCVLLLKQGGVGEEDITELVVAGAFGQYLNPESARIIGMYPEIPLEQVQVVGNAAGTGARMALVSKEARQRAEEISHQVRYYELGADPDFMREYANSMFFPYANLDKFPQTKKLLEEISHG